MPGVGRAVSEWLVDGHCSTFDLHDCDVNRFEAHQLAPEYVLARDCQNYIEVYDILHPLQPMEAPRPLRTTPFYPRQRELDGGEPGLRVLSAQRLQSLLGLVLEMLEAWARGQRSGATRRRTRIVCHGIPSFHMRPVSADLGQEVRS